MTISKQRRAEADRARQFFRKPQSSEDRKARLDKLKQNVRDVVNWSIGKMTMTPWPTARRRKSSDWLSRNSDKRRKNFSPSERNRLWSGTSQSASPRSTRR